MARDRYVQPSEGAGYVAFARPDGTIVRGAWDNGRAQVFLADNDGRLTGANGWLVTGDYDGGRMRRYYVDGHIAHPRFAVVRNSDVHCNITVFAECESARNAAKIARMMNAEEKGSTK